MNRFFRSALFPLVVIVLLVYLASQTLIPRRDSARKVTLSDLITYAEAGNVEKVSFNPNRQSITATIKSLNQKVKVNYPTAQSQFHVQQVLEKNHVGFDSKGTGTSTWWALCRGCCPSCC